MPEPLIVLPTAYLLINLATFALFGFDKHRARQNQWRMPEKILLLWAFLGGSFGAKLGQKWFRHKTRKQPFARRLNRIIATQIFGLVVFASLPVALPHLAALDISIEWPELPIVDLRGLIPDDFSSEIFGHTTQSPAPRTPPKFFQSVPRTP